MDRKFNWDTFYLFYLIFSYDAYLSSWHFSKSKTILLLCPKNSPIFLILFLIEISRKFFSRLNIFKLMIFWTDDLLGIDKLVACSFKCRYHIESSRLKMKLTHDQGCGSGRGSGSGGSGTFLWKRKRKRQ